MPKKIFYIDVTKTSSITVTWKGNLKTGTVEKDGVIIGTFNNEEEFNKGKEFILPNKDKIFVETDGSSWMYRDFIVLYNGKPTINERKDPRAYVKSASKGLLILGLIYIVITTVFEFTGLIPIGFVETGTVPHYPAHTGLYLILGTALYFIAGFWLRIHLSVIPMHIGLLLAVVQGSVLVSHMFTDPLMQAPLIVTGFLIYYLVRGIKSVKQIKQQQKEMEHEAMPSKKKMVS